MAEEGDKRGDKSRKVNCPPAASRRSEVTDLMDRRVNREMTGWNVEASRCDAAGCGLGGRAQCGNPGGALCRLPGDETVAARRERGRERPPSLARRLTHSPDRGGRSRP